MEIFPSKNGYLRIKVIPKSNRTEVAEVMIDAEGVETIKIRIKAAPEKGKANAELLKFLAKTLKISKDQISIISGKTEQLKLLKINGPYGSGNN